jgi:hypothetical protein
VLTVEAAAVSEPAPIGLLVLGLVGLTIMRRKRAATTPDAR